MAVSVGSVVKIGACGVTTSEGDGTLAVMLALFAFVNVAGPLNATVDGMFAVPGVGNASCGTLGGTTGAGSGVWL